jgi:hypothetical protein
VKLEIEAPKKLDRADRHYAQAEKLNTADFTHLIEIFSHRAGTVEHECEGAGPWHTFDIATG